MIGSRTWLRTHGAGRLLYRYVHWPREQLALAHTYGWRLAARAWWGQLAMKQAALRLAPIPAAAPDGQAVGPICFLTGPRFIHQTLFCAHSFARATATSAPFEFLSDGGMTEGNVAALLRLFPSAKIRLHGELDVAVARALPPEKFPVLHALRKKFVLLRKLTDAMAGQQHYRMFFDSDMLFWREPQDLLERAAAHGALYMADIADDGYTVSRQILREKFGVTAASAVNSGLVGLNAEKIDWDLLERVCAFLVEAPGDQRLVEQTLWAVALGAQSASPLPAHNYCVVVDPRQWEDAQNGAAPILLHYAWHARLAYTAEEWRRYLDLIRSDHSMIRASK